MKKLIFGIALFVCCSYTMAQTTQTTENKPSINTLSVKSIGLAIDYFSPHAMELTFKCTKGKNAFRMGAEINGVTQDNSIKSIIKNNDSTISIVHQFEYKNNIRINAGMERYIRPEKAVSFYYSGGITAGWGYAKTEDRESIYPVTQNVNIYENKADEIILNPVNKHFDYSFHTGIQVLCGGRFRISDHFNFTTEFKGTSLYVQGLGDKKNTQSIEFVENLYFSLHYCF
jgi:hypothetical protein